MQGYVLLKKSQMAYDERDAVRVLTFAQAGRHERWQLPPRARAEVTQQQALGLAMTGEPLDAVKQKLDEARGLLAAVPSDDPSPLGAYFTADTLLLRKAVTYTEAGSRAWRSSCSARRSGQEPCRGAIQGSSTPDVPLLWRSAVSPTKLPSSAADLPRSLTP
jgi:hypothetical protein